MPPCPRCQRDEHVRELPLREGRRERKRRRTGTAQRLEAITGRMHAWECARCQLMFHTFDEASRAE